MNGIKLGDLLTHERTGKNGKVVDLYTEQGDSRATIEMSDGTKFDDLLYCFVFTA